MATAALPLSLLALLAYAAWTLALLLGIAFQRAALVLRGQQRANSFGPWGDDVSPLSARLCRAHANCVENLPVFASIVFVAVGTAGTDITDPLALWFLSARIAQSAVHLWSVSPRAVALRFGFMATQMLMLMLWVVELTRWAGAHPIAG